jgi:hypothetical protein
MTLLGVSTSSSLVFSIEFCFPTSLRFMDSLAVFAFIRRQNGERNNFTSQRLPAVDDSLKQP